MATSEEEEGGVGLHNLNLETTELLQTSGVTAGISMGNFCQCNCGQKRPYCRHEWRNSRHDECTAGHGTHTTYRTPHPTTGFKSWYRMRTRCRHNDCTAGTNIHSTRWKVSSRWEPFGIYSKLNQIYISFIYMV